MKKRLRILAFATELERAEARGEDWTSFRSAASLTEDEAPHLIAQRYGAFLVQKAL